MKLWVDDVRPAPPGWEWAKTCQQGIDSINECCGRLREVSLDHDLGEKRSGYDVAVHLEGLAARGHLRHLPNLHCHSMNTVGKLRILSVFDSIARFVAQQEPRDGE